MKRSVNSSQGDALFGGAANGLVVDVGEVHDLGHTPPEELEGPPQHVLEEKGPQVADVGEVVDGRPAGVDPGVARLDRLERLETAGQGVVQAQLRISHDASGSGIVPNPCRSGSPTQPSSSSTAPQ